MNRNIVWLFFFFALSGAAVLSAGAKNEALVKVLKFPEQTTLGGLYWRSPKSYSGALEDSRCWHKVGNARGIVRVPAAAVLGLRVSYDAAQHPQLLTAYGPDFFSFLDFSRVEVDDSTLVKISSLAGLQMLDLRDADVSDQGLRLLSSYKKLEDLSLGRTAITDKGLEYLPALDSLKALRLNATKISDAGLKSLRKFPKLEVLSITDCHITDAGLSAIDNLPELVDLVIDGNARVTAKGLAQIVQLKKLRRLSARQTSVAAEDLPTIKQMVEKMESLRRLEVAGPSFTAVEQMKWRQEFPRLKIFADEKVGRASVGTPAEDVNRIFAPLPIFRDR